MRIYTVEEVAKMFRKSVQFVRKEIHRRKLGAVRIGVELRVTEAMIEHYLKNNLARGPVECRDPRRGRDGT